MLTYPDVVIPSFASVMILVKIISLKDLYLITGQLIVIVALIVYLGLVIGYKYSSK